MMDESFPSSTADIGFGQGDASLIVQPVHSSGVTRVVHAPAPQNSREIYRLFTAGDDYLVRILPAQVDPNFEPLIIDDATKSITWIDADSDYLVTAAEDGCIRIYQHSLPTTGNANDHASSSPTDLICILTRSTLAARCVALERHVARGKTPRVAVCTDDLVIKVIDVADPKRASLLTGHERSPRAASWSPLEALLVTSACDGAVKIWNLSTSEPDCLKTFDGLLTPGASDSELNIQACWHPSGESFVVPSKTHEAAIVTRDRSDWRITASLVAGGNDAVRAATGEISAMAFSPNGRYLAISTTDGQITVWVWATRRPLRSKKSTSLITTISWHPGLDALAWSDNAGQLTRWRNVVGSTLPSPCEHVAYLSKDAQKRKAQADEIDDLFEGTGVDDDHDLAIEEQTSQDERQVERHGRDVGYSSRSRNREHAGFIDTTKPQTLFQPTSTPMRNSRRYLSFNTIGSLIAIDQDTHQSISFESFDASARRNWRFVDHFGYDMASIGAHGALMACPEKAGDGEYNEDDEDELQVRSKKGHASNVLFKPFEVPGGWSMPGAEWSIDLPRGETAVAVAMAGRRSTQHVAIDNCTAVVATSAGYLRFMTGSGLQRYIWAFGSQIVTIAAGNRLLLVVHRNGPASDGHQNLLYTLIDVTTLEKRQEGVLPIRDGRTVTWAGFSDLDVPAVFDNQGLLLLLDRAMSSSGQSRWIPGLDTKALAVKEGRSDDGPVSRIKYWPVGLDGQNLLAIMLKGQNVPDASSTSRPIIQDLALSMPVADAESATGLLEEQLLRQTQLASFARSFRSSLLPEEEEDEFYADVLDQPAARTSTLEHEADKAILQIVQHACKANKHQRVIDAARELHSARTLDAALQIGTFFHLSTLVDRMNALRGWVAERAERDERMVVGTQPIIYAAPATSTDSRILVQSSPGPTGKHAGIDGRQAKRALGRDFDDLPVARKQRGARSELAKIGQSPSSAWTDGNRTQTRIEEEENTGQAEDSDAYMAEPNGSPVAIRQKRRSSVAQNDDEDDDDDVTTTRAEVASAAKRAREFLATSPFSNKTNKTFAKPSAPSSTAGKNPFARTATNGLTRDKSMHKSNSFFDRVDTAANARSTSTGAQKTKQATLFSTMTAGARSDGGNGGHSPLPAATPVFGEAETQQSSSMQDTQMDQELALARRLDEQSQVQMEETQYAGEEEDSLSMRDSQAASIAVS